MPSLKGHDYACKLIMIQAIINSLGVTRRSVVAAEGSYQCRTARDTHMPVVRTCCLEVPPNVSALWSPRSEPMHRLVFMEEHLAAATVLFTVKPRIQAGTV